MIFTRNFSKISSFFSIIFCHAFWGLFFGDPLQEVHIIVAYILLYFTTYYLIDDIAIFSRIIQREAEY